MSGRPKILFLSPAWPLGAGFGGQLRALHTARALKRIGDVTVMVVGSEATDRGSAAATAAEFDAVLPAAAVEQPKRGAWDRLRWAVDVRYLNVHGVGTSPGDRARVLSYFGHYDLVWVLNARTPNLLQIWHWPHSHLDLDDIPSTYVRRTAQTEHGLNRWKARTHGLLLQRRERRFTDRFTTLSVCSEADRAYFRRDRVHVIPNGFVRPPQEPSRPAPASPPRIGFIGLYSHVPNRDGVTWFLRESWPAIRRQVPGIRLRIVGRDSDGPLRPAAPDVDALGWLPDAEQEIATWSAMIIPLRVGAGTRIKLAEAFSRKCPVVSTRFGAYGYPVIAGQHLLLADSPAEFSRACVQLVRDPELAHGLAEHAWRAFLRYWTWDAIAPSVCAAAEDCLERSAAASLR